MSADLAPRINVRRVRASDIPQLISALAPEVSATQVGSRFQEHLDGYREMLVAELDDNVVGTVSTSGHRFQIPESLRMLALDVGSAYRRQGIGTLLIEAVEAKAQREGFSKVNLEVALGNDGALRLYESLGYRSVGSPVTDRWTRTTEDGRREQVEESSWMMVKDV